MTELELGTATIVYEDPAEGTVETTVQNEQIAYFQDHWIVKAEETESGGDIVRRIPATRVYYVERSVEAFEQEVQTLRDQVESFTRDIRERLLGGETTSDRTSTDRTPTEIEVEDDPDRQRQ